MDVYTVDIGWFRAETVCRPRITKRQVVKAGREYLHLTPLYAHGEVVRVPFDKCYTTLEQAQTELQALVTEKVTQLNTRIGELKSEAVLEESYVFKSE